MPQFRTIASALLSVLVATLKAGTCATPRPRWNGVPHQRLDQAAEDYDKWRERVYGWAKHCVER